jgi:2-(1,2-epoxy-1,2-dihydrophenyl)acetyl-CoA isomerase
VSVPLVQLSRLNGHARLTLARPDRANSLDQALLTDLVAALDALSADPPEVLILSGEGRHFSTGGDIARFAAEVEAGNGVAYAQAIVGTLHEAILRLLSLPCPVIAELRGATTGGALGLVLAADLVVMREDAFIQPFYAVVGFGPDGGWTALLPDRIGTARALGVQLLNRRIGATDALQLGIATALAASDAELAATTDEWLATLAGHVGGTLTATRRLIWDEARLGLVRARLDAERETFVQRIQETETRSGMAAFLASLRGSKQS